MSKTFFHPAHPKPGLWRLPTWLRPYTVGVTRVWDFPSDAVDKNLPASSGDRDLIPGPEHSTCHRATKPMCHNCWVWALEPKCHNYRSLGTWSPCSTREVTAMRSLLATARENLCSSEDPAQIKLNFCLKKKESESLTPWRMIPTKKSLMKS